MSSNRPQCPSCGGYRSHKNGNNFLDSGFKIQRWYCPKCRKTFQELRVIPFLYEVALNYEQGSIWCKCDGSQIAS